MAIFRKNKESARNLTPPEVAGALARLERAARQRPELEVPARQFAPILEGIFREPLGIRLPILDRAAIEFGWREGIPAFRVCQPEVDRPDLRAKGVQLAGHLARTNPSADDLRRAIEGDRLDLADSARRLLTGEAALIEERSAAVGLDPSLVGSVLRLILVAPLAGIVTRAGLGAIDGRWERGDCPYCGSPPILAESRGLEQRRFLRCGLCTGSWPADRLRCPACGETDHRALSYRYAEGEQDRWRLACCATCGARLKVVATLGPLGPAELLVVELETIHLDLIDPDGPAPVGSG